MKSSGGFAYYMIPRVLEKLAGALEKFGIPYIVIGGQAVLVYGEPRLTVDIDVTLGRGAEQIDEVLTLLQSLGWKSLVSNPSHFVKDKMVLPCQDPESGVRVDLIFSNTEYEKAALQRFKKVKIGMTDVRFASLEDVVIQKVFAGRPRDLEDVRVLLNKNKELDYVYVRRWLKGFDQELGQSLLQRFESIVASLKG